MVAQRSDALYKNRVRECDDLTSNEGMIIQSVNERGTKCGK